MSESSTCRNCGKELFVEDICPVCQTPIQNPSSPDANSTSANPTGASSNVQSKSRKYVWIGIGVAALVALIAASIGINQYAMNNLQFRPSSTGKMDLATLSADMTMDVCNPTVFPTSFDKITMQINYKEKEFATITMKGKTIPPNQITSVDGRVSINPQMITGLFLQGLASAFSADKDKSVIDPNEMTLTNTIHSTAIGLIPISTSKTFTVSEYQEMIQQRNQSQFSCSS